MKEVINLTARDINRLSLKEITALEAQIAEIKGAAVEKAKSDIKDKIDSLLEGTGFTISDLYNLKKGRRSSLPAKYVNPNNRAQAWTGRGRKPGWLVQGLSEGASLADFEV